MALMMLPGSDNRPAPTCPQLSQPSSGPTNVYPSSLSWATFRWTDGLAHMSQFMAGEHKRTVTLFGENTDKGRQKFQEEIEDIHALFKDFVKTHRPQIDLERVATGEHWFGTRALDCRLVDELRTSDDYLLDTSASADLYEIIYTGKKPWLARLLAQTGEALGRF